MAFQLLLCSRKLCTLKRWDVGMRTRHPSCLDRGGLPRNIFAPLALALDIIPSFARGFGLKEWTRFFSLWAVAMAASTLRTMGQPFSVQSTSTTPRPKSSSILPRFRQASVAPLALCIDSSGEIRILLSSVVTTFESQFSFDRRCQRSPWAPAAWRCERAFERLEIIVIEARCCKLQCVPV